ncbi:hypothetical protein AB6A40_011146 [Gnathostoma spinigerum]|uniref:Uncharacterized protein n=1 Tax=Gnathostoma spinigerum TaxID=75299 RepID=A0ABD6F3N2_9BILA
MYFYDTILVIFTVLPDFTSSFSSPCLLRCKDNNMNEMAKILEGASDWATDLVAPLYTVLKGLSTHSTSSEVLFQRMRQICRSLFGRLQVFICFR